MLRAILTKVVKRKNPHFELDPAVTSGVIFHFARGRVWWLVRGILKQFWHFKKPKLMFVGKGVKLFNARNIKFGKWVQLEDYVYVSALGNQPMILGNNVKIGAFSRVITSTSFNDIGSAIKIGDNVGLGEFAYLGGAGGLEIGDDCIIGQYLSCHPENHNYADQGTLIRLQGTTRQGIKIGNNCWIGSKVTVLDGVMIGDNCVIAAGAVVTKSMPSNVIIGGVPARVLKEI